MKIVFRFQTMDTSWNEYVDWGDARVPVAGERVTLLKRGEFMVSAVFWSVHWSPSTDFSGVTIVGAEVILR